MLTCEIATLGLKRYPPKAQTRVLKRTQLAVGQVLKSLMYRGNACYGIVPNSLEYKFVLFIV